LALAAVVSTGYAWGTLENIRDERVRFEYCTNVRLGVWPDYRQHFRKLCEPPRREVTPWT
jgi:hypothetical protein